MLEYVGVLRKLATKNKVAGDRGSLTTMEHLIAINVFLQVQQVIRFYGLLPRPHKDLKERSSQLHIVVQYVAGGKKKSPEDKKKYNDVIDLVMNRGSTTVKRSLPRKIIASGDNSVSLLVTVLLMLTSIVRERIEAKKDRTSVFKDCEYIGTKAGANADMNGKGTFTTTFSNLYLACTDGKDEKERRYFIERIGEVAVTDVCIGTTNVCLNLPIIAHSVLKPTKAFNRKNETDLATRCKAARAHMDEGIFFLCEVTADQTKSRGGSSRASGTKMSVKTDTFQSIVADLCRIATIDQHTLLLNLANLGRVTLYKNLQEFMESSDADDIDGNTPPKPKLTKALVEEELGRFGQLKPVDVTEDSFIKAFRLRRMPDNNNKKKLEDLKESIVIVSTKALKNIWSILNDKQSTQKNKKWVTDLTNTLAKYQKLGWVTSVHSSPKRPPPAECDVLLLLPEDICNEYFDKDEAGVNNDSDSEDTSDSSDDESDVKKGKGKKRGFVGDAAGDAKRAAR